MTRLLVCVVLCLALQAANVLSVLAYDRRTHGLLTEKAFDTSSAVRDYLRAVRLDTGSVLDGLSATPPNLLSDYVNDGTPRGWMAEGSIREDDYHTSLPELGCELPRNPTSAIDRVRHHFFDPDSLRGLHAGPVTIGLPAPAWALGEQGRGSGPEDNQFSILDARLYQLRSLIEADPDERERQTARLFRSLGQVLHALEDMAQPQHTRNDIHPACENFLSGRAIHEHSWYEEYIEARALGLAFRGRPTRPLRIAGYPAPSLPTFWSYFAHDDRQRGLADFVSHNFFSAGTNLGAQPPCGGRALPPCRLDAYEPADVPHAVVTLLGLRLEAPVRLLRRSLVDPITQATIPDIALTTRSLWDQHLETRGFAPAFSMNVLNYDAISDVLLPRAVGYAAGFLEAFFGGQLEASVHPAGEVDATVLKLVARNASGTAVDGVLLVYAEDTATRRRQNVLTATGAVQPLGAVPTGVVLANASFPEVAFRPPFPAEKYVVVYHGRRLGPHIEDSPTGAIGAVMGRVLGGPRVEAIVSESDRRLLRAVVGSFELPEAAAGLEMIQWSDLDNQFVGLTGAPLVTGRPAPDEVKLFRIERPAGSAEVPLRAGSDPAVVDATRVANVPFPYGLELPTRVDYVQRVRVRQPLLTYERTMTLQWDETSAGYRLVRDDVGPPGLDVPVDDTVTFAERFPIVLDREHLFGITASTPRPYFWRVLEVGQDARGRLLAVIAVELTRPLDADRAVVLHTRSADCATLEPRGEHRVVGVIPGGGLIAVVDVERGETLGVTAAPRFAPSSTELAQLFPTVQVRRVVTHVGGPNPGVETRCIDAVADANPDLPTEVRGTLTLPLAGVTELALPGQYRDDLEAVAATPLGVRAAMGELELVYASTATANHAVRLQAPTSAVSGPLTLLREGTRMRPGSRLSNEVLLRFERPAGIADLQSVLVRWDPQSTVDTRVAIPAPLEPARYRLAAATPSAALLRMESHGSSDVRTVLADLDAGTLRSYAGDLTGQFVLLPPTSLYSVTSQHFHTLDGLAETALPAALGPGPVGVPSSGAYHVIVRD